MSTLLYRLRDTLCARREFLARKVGRRAVTRAEMICRSIFQGFLNAEKAQAEHSDEARKEWLLWAKDVCYDLIDVLEEMRLKEPKRAFSLLNLHTTGINKVKRIIYRLALLAAYAESLGLLRGGVQGQEEDGERTPFSGLEFLLIDGNKVGTGMLREALEAAVVVSSIVYENPPPEALRERSNTTWAESAQNHLIELFEELKKQQEAKTARGSRKIKRIVKELGTLIDEEAERMRLCPAPIQMENPAGLRATPSATSFAHHEIKFRGQRQTDREELVQKVVQQKEDESHNGGKTSKKGCEFIYVVGDVGMGKSAMARSVYSDENVTKKFPNRAWVDFSGKFDKRHLLKVIINRLTSDPTYEVETEALELRVRQVVKKKKCLVVLDNVQCGSGDDDEEDFSSDHMHEFLRKLFKDCDAVSRILITTREVKNVPSDEKSEANTITLDKLCEDDWVSIVKDCLFGLTIDETVRNEVIKHYDGKALTAKSISRIVRFKDSIPQGLKVLESYEGDRFALSYFVMPDSLRQCLLYCNLFPENQSIDVGKLIKLWMANDFAVSNPEDMERMGWGYIQQLLDHSVFQEFRRDGHGGSFKCKLEGEVINFIRRIAEDECHIMHLDSEKMARNKYGSVFPRHCTLNVASQSPLPKSIAYATELHTLIILSKYSSVDPTNLANLLSHMRRLRALGLSSCSIKKLPRSVGKMLHLRYLDLSFNHNLKKLPEAICDLLNLQSLNLNGCRRLQKLPEGIGKLTKLRHLEILWTTSLTYLPKGIASLTSLRTLSRFFGNSGLSSKACNLGDLGKLNQIKGSIIIDRLGDKTDASSAIKANLKGKKDLLGLELRFTVAGSESYHNDEKILQDLEAPPELQVLGIFYYRGESFPRWMMALDKLTHLLLADCNNCSDMPALGKLPSLVSLKIQNMSKVKEVGYGFLGIEPKKCDRGQEVSSFPKLEELCFQNMDNWEKWIGIANHAKIMPSLWSLSIINCRKIKENPLYIMAKKNLRYDITHCPILATNLGCRKPKTGDPFPNAILYSRYT